MTPTQSEKWKQPGYSGKLKTTPLIKGQPGYEAPKIDSGEMIETAFDLFANGIISEETVNRQVVKSYAF